MYCDIAGEQRLAHLMQVLRDLSRDPDPVSSVNRFSASMRHLSEGQGLISVSLRGMPAGSYRVMRFLHQPGLADDTLRDVPFAGADAPARQGGILGDIIAWERPTVIRNLDVPEDPVLGAQLAPYRLLMASPVFFDGEPTNWVIYLATDPDSFPQPMIESRFLTSNLMGNLTNSKRLMKELREANAWIEREVDEIAAIQRGLLPVALPPPDRIDIAATQCICERAAGDYYDVVALTPDGRRGPLADARRYGVFIADASGHGPSAAVVAAIVNALFHSFPGDFGRPDALLTHLNRHLAGKRINLSFVTAFYGVVDIEAATLTYACAGHPMPVQRDPAGAVEPLPLQGGLPLGIDEACVYERFESPLPPGGALLLYTDGVTDARSPAGELFSDAGLLAALQRPPAAASCADMLHALFDALNAHQAGGQPSDDQTVLLAGLPPR